MPEIKQTEPEPVQLMTSLISETAEDISMTVPEVSPEKEPEDELDKDIQALRTNIADSKRYRKFVAAAHSAKSKS